MELGDGSYDSGIGITYSNGDLCSGNLPRTTTVYVSCDESAGYGFLSSVTESSRCSYTL